MNWVLLPDRSRIYRHATCPVNSFLIRKRAGIYFVPPTVRNTDKKISGRLLPQSPCTYGCTRLVESRETNTLPKITRTRETCGHKCALLVELRMRTRKRVRAYARIGLFYSGIPTETR